MNVFRPIAIVVLIAILGIIVLAGIVSRPAPAARSASATDTGDWSKPTISIPSVATALPTATTVAATATPVLATATPWPTATPAPPTATPAPPTATPVPVGTRANPVPFGQAHELKAGNAVYTLQVVKVERRANGLLQKHNQFNADPPEGQDYLMAYVKLVYLRGPEDKPLRTGTGSHRFYALNRFWGGGSGSMPEPTFANQDIFPGAEVEGWLNAKFVPVGEHDTASLVYDDVYFALR